MTDPLNNTVVPTELDSFYKRLSETDKLLAMVDLCVFGTYCLKEQPDGSVKRIDPKELWND